MKIEPLLFTEAEIMQRLLQLQDQSKLKLIKTAILPAPKLKTYLRMEETRWYWICIMLATVTTLTVVTIHENSNPLMYIRNILGAIFVLFLPGYSLIKLIFPEKEIDHIKRTALSIGMSLALVPIIGLILYYTPWGIQTEIITLCLFAVTILFATVAVLLQYQKQNQ